jgi:hypothetical protein
MAVTSWTSEGMNWDNIDPSDINYYEAIYQALLERINARGLFGADRPIIPNLGGYFQFHPLSNVNSGSGTYNGGNNFFNYVNQMIEYLTGIYLNYIDQKFDQGASAFLLQWDDWQYAPDGENADTFYSQLENPFLIGGNFFPQGFLHSSDMAKHWLRQCYDAINLFRTIPLVSSVSGFVVWQDYNPGDDDWGVYINVTKPYMPNLDGVYYVYGRIVDDVSLIGNASFNYEASILTDGAYAWEENVLIETVEDEQDDVYAIFEPELQFKNW